MENDLLDSLSDIGYTGPMTDRNKLMTAVRGGPKDVDFTNFVQYLTDKLRDLCNIDESVNAIKGPEDSISFLLELSSFLKELGCPYECLSQGHISDRLSTDHEKLLLLDYLASELMAAQMVKVNNPDKNLEVKIQESSTASDLKQILQALKFSKPPTNITAGALFQKVIPKLQETVRNAGDDLVGRPLFNGTLNEKQWAELQTVHDDLDKDYTIRREMLLKRLDCTIQSFQWSDKLKGKEDKIVQIYHNKRRTLKVDPGLNISDILAARDDLAIIEKTSSASVRKNTKTDLNKLIIGRVPDRGGRPSEQQPPPPEMPSWQQRSAGPAGGGRGGGRGGQSNRGGYDNFNRGGGSNYQNQHDNRSSGNFDNRGSGNFSNNRGSGNFSDNRGGGNFSDNRSSGNFSDNRGGGNFSDNRGGSNFSESRGGSFNDNFSNQNYSGGGGRGYNRGGGGRSFEQFQHNKTSYADQYVQDSQHNKQYDNRGGYDSPRGQRRGRSNYNRGNYR